MKTQKNWIKTTLMLLALGLPNAAQPHAGHDHETTGGSTGTATAGETTGGTSGSGSEGTAGETTGTTSGSTTGEGTTSGTSGTGGTETDADGDGLLDWKEAELGTDPEDADSDDDGTIDALDCQPLEAAAVGCKPIAFPEPDLTAPRDDAITDAETGTPLTTALEGGPLGSNGGCSLLPPSALNQPESL